jgi:hypothetical protein
MLRFGNSPDTQPQALAMKLLLRHRFNCFAGLAIAALLSACGGGGSPAPSAQSSLPGAAAAPSTAPVPAAAAGPASPDAPSSAATPVQASEVPVPQPASVPAQLPWDDPAAIGYTVIPAAPLADTGGEAPYPDLRGLPTRAMAFESVAFGDVTGVAVKPAP